MRVMSILWDAERVNVLRYRILAQAKFYESRGPRRTSIMRLASATISSVLLFSRLTGLFGHGVVEPGEKIDALHPFPTGQTSIPHPLYSIIVIVRVARTGRRCNWPEIDRQRGWVHSLRQHEPLPESLGRFMRGY